MSLLNTELCRQSLLQLQSCLYPKSNLCSDLNRPLNFSSAQREFQIPPNQIISILCFLAVVTTKACGGREVFLLSLMSQKCWQQTHSIKMIEKKPDTLILWKKKNNKATGHIISYGREIISWGEQHLFAAEAAAADLDPSLLEAGAGQTNWDMPGHWTSWACPHWAEGRLTSKGCMSPVKQQILTSPLCCKETSDELTQSTAAHVTLVIDFLEQFLPLAALRIGTGSLMDF